MTEKVINDYIVKMSGKVSILEPILIDHNYTLKLDCAVVAENLKTNENGTFNIEYKIEPMRVELIDETGKSLKAKDPRTWSQKLRAMVLFESRRENLDEQIEYDSFMLWIIKNFNLIWGLYSKNKNG